MNILFYAILVFLSYYIGKIDKPVRVAGISIATPLLILTIIGIALMGFSIFMIVLVLMAVFLLIMKKLKFIIGVKLALLCGTMAASLFGIFAGPPGWVVSAIALVVGYMILSSLKNMAISTYKWIFTKLGQILLFIRRQADNVRQHLPVFLRFLVAIVEIPLVCGLAVNGIWQLMNKFDKTDSLTPGIILCRIGVIIPFIVVTYRSYLRDTTPPKKGGEGFDLPGPDLSEVLTGMMSH